ncbi:MAG: hypothetical protein OXI50_06610 [Gammaproteobacteria bacterium]|nr:hypothetical protein [Gammaproteobacteria bacterium]MYD99748.1 hypothetical protein [Alphaproteobacteria bacterium]
MSAAAIAMAQRAVELRKALERAIGLLRGYAQSDFESWTNDEEEFDDPDLQREDAGAWAAIAELEAVARGRGAPK